MGAKFHHATVEDALDLGTGTTSRNTLKLPTAHPISRIFIRERATHGAAITITQDLIEVLVDGSPVLSGLSGADLSKITKFDTGRQPDNSGAGTTEHIIEQVISFGRFPKDPEMYLPAPAFSNVQLRVNSTLDDTPVLHELDVVVEEIISGASGKPVMRKRSLVDATAAVDDAQRDIDLPDGTALAAVYIDYADVDNVDGALIQLGVNNFAERIYNAKRTAIEAMNRQEFAFDDDAIPATMVCLDLDHDGSITGALDTRRQAGVSDVQLRYKAASSGSSGDVRVIAEEYLPL